jgi:HrpA-like RNA helicase
MMMLMIYEHVGGEVLVLALHSALSTGDQHLVFDPPPPNTTKVRIRWCALSADVCVFFFFFFFC